MELGCVVGSMVHTAFFIAVFLVTDVFGRYLQFRKIRKRIRPLFGISSWIQGTNSPKGCGCCRHIYVLQVSNVAVHDSHRRIDLDVLVWIHLIVLYANPLLIQLFNNSNQFISPLFTVNVLLYL